MDSERFVTQSELEGVATLEARFRRCDAIVGIIGLGYVGLPLAQTICNKGFRIIGFDLDPVKIHMLERGKSYIRHIPAEAITTLIQKGLFQATTNFVRLQEADVIIICVPTPLNKHREPDLSYVDSTTREIAKQLRPGQLIVLESTTYPGTCTEVMLPVLEATGLRSGRDFFLAYSPEREDPGNPNFVTAGIPKVVGADGEAAQRLALAFYDQVVVRTVPVSSLQAAEAVKLTENIFRAVNIALVNELKVVYAAMGIDIWEIIEAAKSKPFGYMPFYPGPGLGGHCIPIDPFYLTWKAREFGMTTRFIELAGEINIDMPHYVIGRLTQALDQVHERGLKGSRILIVGLAYKKNVDDVRESPALRLIELLEARGAVVSFYDPFVHEVPSMRDHPTLRGRRSVDWDTAMLGGLHAALIATDHDDLDYAALAANCPLVIDTRNACERHGVGGTNIVKA